MKKKNHWRLDFTFSANSHLFNPAFSVYHSFWFGKKNQWVLSPGLRLNNVMHDGIPQADKELSRKYPVGFEGNSPFTSGYIPNLNLFIQSDLVLTRKSGIGMNIDLAGLGYNVFNVGKSGKSFITSRNLLIGPGKDLGSLNSEFYVFVYAGQGTELKFGLSHYSLALGEGVSGADPVYFNLGFAGIRFPL